MESPYLHCSSDSIIAFQIEEIYVPEESAQLVIYTKEDGPISTTLYNSDEEITKTIENYIRTHSGSFLKLTEKGPWINLQHNEKFHLETYYNDNNYLIYTDDKERRWRLPSKPQYYHSSINRINNFSSDDLAKILI